MLKSSVLLVIILCISFNTAHRINREDAWAFLLRNAMARMQMQSSGATTCREASLDPGCCVWNGQSCQVEGGECYCDNLCKLFGDCCCDVLEVPPCDFVPSMPSTRNNRCLETTTSSETLEFTTSQPDVVAVTSSLPPTTLPPTCSAHMLNNGIDGCCDITTEPGCFVIVNDLNVCFCDRGCHNISNHDQCCEDVISNGCYPRNCAEAGKTNCVIQGTEDCRVQFSPSDSCYCNIGCTNDCCDDAPTSSSFEVSGPSMAQMENLLEVIRKDHSTLYERMAAAFWRRYNNMKRKQQKKVLNKKM